MKKRVYMIALALIAAGGIFWSCQKDEFLNNQDDLFLKKATVAATPVTFTWTEACAGEVTTFTLTGDGQKQIRMWDWDALNEEYDWIQLANAGNSSNPLVLDTVLSAGTYYLIYKIGNTWVPGNSSSKMLEGIAVEIEDCGCEESFSYETNDMLSVVFNYISDTLAENAIVKFTCPHITGFTSNDGKTYTVNNSGNQTVLSWTGTIEACVPITFDLTYVPDCSKANQGNGNINICTDFKLNESSLKGITPPENKTEWATIKYSGCSN